MNAGNKNAPSMYHPRRRHVTTSMDGLKNGHISKNLTKNGEPQRYIWGNTEEQNWDSVRRFPVHSRCIMYIQILCQLLVLRLESYFSTCKTTESWCSGTFLCMVCDRLLPMWEWRWVTCWERPRWSLPARNCKSAQDGVFALANSRLWQFSILYSVLVADSVFSPCVKVLYFENLCVCGWVF